MRIFLAFKKKIADYTLPIIIFILLFLMVKDPKLVIENARLGLYTWFNILLPSLLPFMILSDILISSNSISLFAGFFDPLMKSVYNISGQGALPLIITSFSGYPIGAKLTSQIRKHNLISQGEANKLIGFSSTSGPLFILGTVAIGMLNTSDINFLLIFPHFFGAFTLGLFFRFLKVKGNYTISTDNIKSNLDKKEIQKDLSIGKLISDSVKNSMNNILLIGGFIILYSVLIEMLFELKIINSIIIFVSKYLNIDNEIIKALLSGIIELTHGCINIANLNTHFMIKIIMLNFIIAWGGFSIHSQSLSFIYETDINPFIYLISKLAHGVLSVFYTIILYLLKYRNYTFPSFSLTPISKNIIDFNICMSTFLVCFKITIWVLSYFFIISLIFLLIFKKNKEA